MPLVRVFSIKKVALIGGGGEFTVLQHSHFEIFLKKGTKNFFWKINQKKDIFGKFLNPPKFWNPNKTKKYSFKTQK